MMRSLYSGVSGLKTHQTKMDVIGNNIANVNTVAFKSSSVTFGELMYQTTSNASGPNANTGRGGVNAKQIGLGVAMGATNVSITTTGATQTTGNPFDIKITGDSFFIVNDGKTNYFTRAGAFYVDAVGNLAMTSTGYNVMGWQVGDDGQIIQNTVSQLKIMSAKNMYSQPEATEKGTVSGVLDKSDPNLQSKDGKILSLSLYDDLGYEYTAKFAVKPIKDATGKDVSGEYTIELTELIDVAQQQANKGLDPSQITNPSTVDLSTLPKTNAQTTATPPIAGGINLYKIKYDTTTGEFKYIVPYGAGDSGNPTSTTGTEMTLPLLSIPKTGNDPNANQSRFKDITIDFSSTKNVNNEGSSTIGMKAGDEEGNGAGKLLGTLKGVSIDSSGKIYGAYDNGNTELLGQIAVTEFANASGLEKVGENLYQTTLNSGEFDGIGKDISALSGSMSTGVLEMSNVDLSAEFTDMITTQRGFQANSRIITTSDTLLEELINLKR